MYIVDLLLKRIFYFNVALHILCVKLSMYYTDIILNLLALQYNVKRVTRSEGVPKYVVIKVAGAACMAIG